MNDDIKVKIAKKMALSWINENRQKDGKSPIRRIESLWWELYGPDWIKKVDASACKKSIV